MPPLYADSKNIPKELKRITIEIATGITIDIADLIRVVLLSVYVQDLSVLM